MVSEALRSLVVDHWYKALLIICTAFLGLALTTPLQVSNRAVAAIALGGLLFSLGQWINHPLQERVDRLLRYKITGHPRSPSVGGVGCEIVGVALAAWGIYGLAFA